jgi:hypothetical protein
LEAWVNALVVRVRRMSVVRRVLVMAVSFGGKLLTPNPIPTAIPVIF